MKDEPLGQKLERLGRLLVEDIESWEKKTRDTRRDSLERLTRTVERKIERAFDKEERRRQREEERLERRRRAAENASPAAGVVFLLAAVGCALFAATQPQLWWLIFVALGFGLSGASTLSRAGKARRRRQALEATAPVEAASVAAPSSEVDALCDGLLAELKDSPEAVRSFLSAPEKTIQSMRTTAKALEQRRAQLLQDAPRAQLQRLGAQRAELVARRAQTADSAAQAHLDQALVSLDSRGEALQQLSAAADRVDGEYVSLLVHLQELKTRVALAKTATTPVQLDALKASVGRLSDELGAITQALVEAQSQGLSPVVDVAGADGPRSAAERDRA